MSKTIYYFHPTVDYLLDHEDIRTFITDNTMEHDDNIVDVSTPLALIEPQCMTVDTDFTSFFRGITISNLKFVLNEEEGTGFLNPFSYGLLHDTDYTIQTLTNLGFFYNHRLLHLPYEIYEKAFNDLYDEEDTMFQAFIEDKETYDATMEHQLNLVNEIVYGEYAYANQGQTLH